MVGGGSLLPVRETFLQERRRNFIIVKARAPKNAGKNQKQAVEIRHLDSMNVAFGSSQFVLAK